MGQLLLGFTANTLEVQQDCVGQVHFFDAVLHNQKGEAKNVKRVVCVHEEDAGILWKHTAARNPSLTRSQRLVLTMIATVGNYDYIFNWMFYQDGKIEFNVKLTRILSVHLLAANATPAGHGTIVSPRINAPFHQHFFSLRLDAEIDGNENTVEVLDVVPVPDETGTRENPYGQGFTSIRIPLKTAGSAKSNICTETSYSWLFSNQNSIHPCTNEPVGWKLIPWTSPQILLKTDSPIHPQAAWMDYNTWVTPYQKNQLFSGEFYLNNSGLSEGVARNASANIENTDVVIWHNFGLSHIPRVEDWPVMPVE
ncbi:unnamed protein product [Orchesella dallaii]|uniref:Amine oxidase n=1 Tax=Orchesella dallaii TaxID=48710 RepID=A0ABP1PIF4_9HEXA